jgi:hypothetical protein
MGPYIKLVTQDVIIKTLTLPQNSCLLDLKVDTHGLNLLNYFEYLNLPVKEVKGFSPVILC